MNTYNANAIPNTFIRTSAILWEGPSQLDGAPIVVIAVGFNKGRSKNSKTGAMVQTHILRADVSPTAAIKSGEDASICGSCPHRGTHAEDGTSTGGRTCYVNVGQGPLGVWKAYKRGRYAKIDIHAAPFAGRSVRLGTYGDPAAVPTWVWNAILEGTTGRTGYTHQWLTCDPELRGLVMASCDSMADLALARSGGWRSFLVIPRDHQGKIKGAATCPASEEAGYKLTCETCLACNGATGRRGDIAIKLHGGTAVVANETKLRSRVAFA